MNPDIIDTVVFGNVAQSSIDAPYLARHVGLRAGAPEESIAQTVNRLCGSGFQSIVSGCQEILTGEASVALVGGTESMTQTPLSVYGQNARFGVKLGNGIQVISTVLLNSTLLCFTSPFHAADRHTLGCIDRHLH